MQPARHGATGAIEIHTPAGVTSYRAEHEAASAALPGFRVTGAELIR